MLKTLTLLILINNPDGSQIIQSSTEMSETACLTLQSSIWKGDNKVIGHDDKGNIMLIDAACVPSWFKTQ